MRNVLRDPARRLRNFCRRPAAGKSLRLRALAVLVAVRIALGVFPFARVRKSVERSSLRRRQAEPRHSRQDVIEAVQAAARDVAGVDCLSQALALRVLLAREGYPAEVHVSIARLASGALRAHAWVQSGPVTAPCGAADLSGRADGSVPDFEV